MHACEYSITLTSNVQGTPVEVYTTWYVQLRQQNPEGANTHFSISLKFSKYSRSVFFSLGGAWPAIVRLIAVHTMTNSLYVSRAINTDPEKNVLRSLDWPEAFGQTVGLVYCWARGSWRGWSP